VLRNEDFNDDSKDAGDMGAGHSVTALYEVEPVAQGPVATRSGAPVVAVAGSAAKSAPLVKVVAERPMLTLRVRYKDPGQSESRLLTFATGASHPLSEASGDFRFAAAVASFGLVLRDSQFKGSATLPMVDELAASAVPSSGQEAHDPGGYRAEFRQLVNQAELLGGSRKNAVGVAR
jgi:Ca-activated chloride channel family protein